MPRGARRKGLVSQVQILGLGWGQGMSYSVVSVGDTYTYVHIIIARHKAPHCTKFERGWEVTSTVRESSGESPTS